MVMYLQCYAKDSEDYVKNRLSIYNLITIFSTIPISFAYGLLTDKFKVWKMLLFQHFLLIGCISLFVIYVPTEDHIFTKDSPEPLGMTIGYLLLHIIGSATATLNFSLMTKSIAGVNLSRGVFLCTTAMCSSLGIFLVDAVGGHIYAKDKRAPYFICLGTESCVILIIIVFALFR